MIYTLTFATSVILVQLVLNHCSKSQEQDMCVIFGKSDALVIAHSGNIHPSWSLADKLFETSEEKCHNSETIKWHPDQILFRMWHMYWYKKHLDHMTLQLNRKPWKPWWSVFWSRTIITNQHYLRCFFITFRIRNPPNTFQHPSPKDLKIISRLAHH